MWPRRRGWSWSWRWRYSCSRRGRRCRWWYCRAVARSSGVIDEAGDCSTERRGHCPGGGFATRSIYYHNKVMTGGHRERVSRCADRGTEAADTSVAKVIRVHVSRIVYLIVGDALDISGSIEISIDCHSVTTRRAARVTEVERLVIVRSGKTASGTGLTTASARAAIAADTIRLGGIACC